MSPPWRDRVGAEAQTPTSIGVGRVLRQGGTVYHAYRPRLTHGLTPFTDSCLMCAAVQTRIGRRRTIRWFYPLRCRERQDTGDQFSGMTYRLQGPRRACKTASIA